VGDVKLVEKDIVKAEDFPCVWKLDCPYCGYLLGLCLDLTHEQISPNAKFIVQKRFRKPDRFPKKEGGRIYAYFQPHTRQCKRCGALCVRDYELESWLAERDISFSFLDFDDFEDYLLSVDPNELNAIIHSDRVYAIQFEEWGINGMPCRYLFIKDEKRFLSMLDKKFISIHKV